jgi:AcrR family transcriptional regulator
MTKRHVVSPTSILDAALRVTAQEGLEAASLRRVAEEAGTSKSSVLHHFGSAAGLRSAMLARAGGLYQELAVRASASGTAAQILDAVFDRRNRALFQCVHELLTAAARDPALAGAARTNIDRVMWTIAMRLDPPLDTGLGTAQALLAAVQGFIHLWVWSGDVDPKPYREAAERAAVALIRARPEPSSQDSADPRGARA